jgi:hypothetical protein
MKIKPFITCVGDYHEFDYILDHFYNAGIDINKFIEIDCCCSEISPNRMKYHAIFFNTEDKEEALEWRELLVNSIENVYLQILSKEELIIKDIIE